jgi:AAA family ATP:ADP antiporter
MNTENSNYMLKLADIGYAILPIERWEYKKFLPFALMIGITVFNFTMLRNMKDTLVLTAPESGAEAVTYLKTLGVLPIVILCSALYVRLRKNVSFERSYNLIVSMFLSFIAVFIFVLYPNAQSLHMSPESVAALKVAYPRIQFIFPIIGVWTYSLFYIVAELWSSICLSVLFWQFANDNIGTEEAKRFYPPFLFVNALATFLVGLALKSVSGPSVIESGCYIILCAGVFMLFLFRFLNKQVLVEPKYTQYVAPRKKKSKIKKGFVESMKQLVASPYIGYLSLLILSYGMSINLIEVSWKSAALKYYPAHEDYMAMMADYSIITGLTGLVLVIISKTVLRKYGWLACALVTPIIITLTSFGYFSSQLFPGAFEPWMLAAGFTSPLAFTVSFGMLGVILSKSSKYSFFDPTKEMAYIPLDYELRISGKAAADGVGGRLGKSGASWLQMMLYAIVAGGQAEIMPFLTIALAALSVIWITSAFRLSAMYEDAVQKQAEEDAVSA